MTDDVSQVEARLMGAVGRMISVAPRLRSSGGVTWVRDAGDDAIDMLEQARASAPEGSARRARHEGLLARLGDWNSAVSWVR